MTLKEMKRNVRKTKKHLKNKIDFFSVEKYLDFIGYQVIFYNTAYGDKELRRYNLEEKAKQVSAVTYKGKSRIVFINNNTAAEDKTYLLYHELGHIILKHLDSERMDVKSKCLMELEADTFAFLLMNT